MTKTTCSTFGFVQLDCLFPFCALMASNDHLGNAFAVIYHKFFLTKVDEDDAEFTTIVSVDCSRRVQHGDAFFQGKAATRANLRLVTHWQLNR